MMEDLPLPPRLVPSNVKPEAPPKHSIMIRLRGSGTNGRRISLSTDHFKVSVKNTDAVFYQYCVLITYEDKRPVEGMGIGRKLVDKLCQTYSSEFAGKKFAYDGEKALYTVGPLPRNKLEFTVVLEESFAKSETEKSGSTDKRMKRCSNRSKSFNVEISYAAKIPLKSIALALQGADVDNTQDALRVLDIILRQKAAKMGCLLVRQSFFHDDSRNYVDIGGGVTGLQGFHSSFRPTQGGLSLNTDVSTTMIVTPGPVIDFLLANQGVREPRHIDWVKAKRMLKNMRITTRHRNMEGKIIGSSEKSCNNQMFTLKLRSRDGTSEGETMEITVYEYFVRHCGIELTYSQHMPCIDIGKPKRPIYVPIELCALVSLQRYTKALSSQRRASLVENSRQKPQERIRRVTDATQNYPYDDDSILAECGMFVTKQLSQMEGRILEVPKTLLKPTLIDCWIDVNFSALCDTSQISRELINCGTKKDILIEGPFAVLEEEPQSRRQSPVIRVEQIKRPWRKKSLCDFGIVTQCISPAKINDQYITNVLLKINSKLGGINSSLALEHSSRVPLIKDTPTMILGMDVSHGFPGRSDMSSVPTAVGPPSWPLISRYRAAIRTQSPEVEMIDALYKPLENGKDDGIIRCINPNIKPEVQEDIVGSMHGTTIIWVHNLGMLVVGVDSMATVKYIANDPKNRRTYELVASTKEDKFPEISPGVYATLCGDGNRCQEMVEYVHMELQDVIYMGLTPAFTSVLQTISYFFRIVSPWDGEPYKLCTVYICHWLPQENDYEVFAVGDLIDKPKIVTDWVFGSGSGSYNALHDLRQMAGFIMIDGTAVKDKLVEATFIDPHTGGNLGVYVLQNGRREKLFEVNLVAELLYNPRYVNIFLNRRCMFAFIRSEDASILSPQDLRIEIDSFAADAAVLTRSIHWLSLVRNDTVLIYLVVLLSEEASNIWFYSCNAFNGAIRWRWYTNRDGQDCNYYVGYASLELLTRAVNMNTFQDFRDLAGPRY